MDNDGMVGNQSRNEETLNTLSRRKGASKVGFVALLVLYVLVSVGVRSASSAQGVILLNGIPIPAQSLAGIFSSIANFCLIFLVVFYRKVGFLVSLGIMLVQVPRLVYSIVVMHGYASITGLFTNVFAIAAILLIYLNSARSEQYQSRLREEAIRDRLTGLPNRFAYTELVNRLVEEGERFAVATIDLNNFKSINDTMGQATGDEVLIELGKRLSGVADSEDTKTLDFVAHQGGDEFMLVIRDFASDAELRETVEHYESVVEEKMTIDDCDYVVTASVGYAEYPLDANSADVLFAYAEAAMYEAKRRGSGGSVRRFTPDILDAEHTLEVERKIRGALDNDTLYFHLQPQYDISKRLRGFEALARMTDEEGGFISPGEFIPVAEKVGLVDKIDACIFRKAALFMGELIRTTGTKAMLSVNVSVRHLMKNDFLDEVCDIIAESGVPASQIEIEITESVMIESAEKALECIGELKAMGIKVAIDDFGTGYSSLSYLSSFPADLLKVDKSFIDAMNSSHSSKQYVAAIISIGHIMNFDVISEGVEDPEQLETLRSIGCDYIQGFIWGRPMPPEEARSLVLAAA